MDNPVLLIGCALTLNEPELAVVEECAEMFKDMMEPLRNTIEDAATVDKCWKYNLQRLLDAIVGSVWKALSVLEHPSRANHARASICRPVHFSPHWAGVQVSNWGHPIAAAPVSFVLAGLSTPPLVVLGGRLAAGNAPRG